MINHLIFVFLGLAILGTILSIYVFGMEKIAKRFPKFQDLILNFFAGNDED